MQRIVSAEEMRWCDETTIKAYGVPGMLLMENAGHGVVDVIKHGVPSLETKIFLVVCGKGNNGGDGFVIARLLSNLCKCVHVLLLASPADLKGDAKTNFKILQQFAKKSFQNIILHRYSKRFLSLIPEPDIIIDAMFGTGFSGPVRKPFADVIDWMNTQGKQIIAVDIPSGIHGTTGVVENYAVRAERTVTFGSVKSGLLCNQGRELAGILSVVDIGIPRPVSNDQRLHTWLVEQADVRRIIPKRPVHAHKYSVGKVLVPAGSKGLTGAAALCSTAAMRSGAGAVILGTPQTVYPILARKLTEVMTYPLPETGDGTLSREALHGIREKLPWADVVILGPGLSQNQETQQLILQLLLEFHGKVLIDADGLNAIAAIGISKFRSARAQLVLTPHVGEFSRLTGLPPAEIEHNRIEAARDLAKRMVATVVLKGVPTVTALKDGNCFLNPTGNPGMATAGTGDVLSGIIAGLWAQRMTAGEAAYAGVYLHGLSGDLAVKKTGVHGLLAHDLIDYLPSAMQSV